MRNFAPENIKQDKTYLMKRKYSVAGCLAGCLLTTLPLSTSAEEVSVGNKVDSLRNVDIEEVVIVASPKETQELRRQPVSASVLGAAHLETLGAGTLNSLSAFVPGFFMPDYGSRLTSAVYVRGIGSRSGASAVGMYVDNVPMTDKSAYSFSFIDVERVDVLRGSQGTLYGRNSMGGLVRIFTADPLRHHGTTISAGGETGRAGRHVRAVTYIHPAEGMALSVGGFYEGEDGFRTNTATGGRADRQDAVGGKVRAAWRVSDRLRLDLTLSGEASDEAACPYYPVGPDITDRVIAQNRQSSYRRKLFTAGLGTEWLSPRFILSSITSYQYLTDRLFMDQDFSAADVFSLEQKQRLGVVTEELSLKSRPGSRWQWTTGAFGMYQHLETRCPVTFYADGMAMLNQMFSSVLPQRPQMTLTLTDETLPLSARLETPTVGAALFHQSTVDLGGGLSATAGLRLEYERHSLDLGSGSERDVAYRFTMPSFHIDHMMNTNPVVNGDTWHDTWQLLPKVALQYNHRSGRGNVYVAVSKGYRSGGYNVQSYSDLSQATLQRGIMTGVRDYSVETINRLPLPEASKQAAIAGLTAAIDPHIPAAADVTTLAYRPEQSWTYEMGGHLKFFDRRLSMDYTFFLMQTKDQQLARFAESGMGRVMVNAGRSRSCGAEITLRTSLMDERLHLTAAYGYTHAELTEYSLGASKGETVDYSGNRVPYAPEHTLGVMAAFRQPVSCGILRALTAGANLNGAGRIYWDEANRYSQPFYARLDASVGAELKGGVTLTARAKNVTGTDYETFSFESMGNRFAQAADPRSFALDVTWNF